MELGKVIKTFKSNKGNDVVFRYPKWEDLDAMLAYANALIAEDTFIELYGKPLTRDEEAKFLKDTMEQIKKGKKLQLIAEINGQYAGSGELRIGERRKQHVGDLGVSLSAQYREEGIGTELLLCLIGEAKHFGLRLLTLKCFENNVRAIHVYEKLGFKRAGTVPAAISYKSQYVGEVKLYLPLA